MNNREVEREFLAEYGIDETIESFEVLPIDENSIREFKDYMWRKIRRKRCHKRPTYFLTQQFF